MLVRRISHRHMSLVTSVIKVLDLVYAYFMHLAHVARSISSFNELVSPEAGPPKAHFLAKLAVYS